MRHNNATITWKLPARTIHAWGSTLHLAEGCNLCRAKLLKQIAWEQGRNMAPRVPQTEYHPDQFPTSTAWFYRQRKLARTWEPTIEILVDGKSLSVNGNYKQGMIAGFMDKFTYTERHGKKTITAMKGQQIVNCGGGVWVVE